MTKPLKTLALFAATASFAGVSLPAIAADGFASASPGAAVTAIASADRHGRDRDRWRHRGHHDRGDYGGRQYYDEPVYRNTRTWRGDDGRYYCRRSDGTTGLIIGAAAGGLLGREVAGRHGDRTAGLIIGAAGGALLGRAVDRGGSRCR